MAIPLDIPEDCDSVLLKSIDKGLFMRQLCGELIEVYRQYFDLSADSSIISVESVPMTVPAVDSNKNSRFRAMHGPAGRNSDSRRINSPATPETRAQACLLQFKYLPHPKPLERIGLQLRQIADVFEQANAKCTRIR